MSRHSRMSTSRARAARMVSRKMVWYVPISWMPDVMVTSPVPGKGLALWGWLPFLQESTLPASPSPTAPGPIVPLSLTSSGGSHGSCPVPQLGGDEGPVELPAFLPNHTSAVAYPQPWERQEFHETQCLPPPSKSHLVSPNSSSRSPLRHSPLLGSNLQAGMLVPAVRARGSEGTGRDR